MEDLSTYIKEKAKKLPAMHITNKPKLENPANNGYRYFIEFDGVNGIVGRFNSEDELEKEMDRILDSMGL